MAMNIRDDSKLFLVEFGKAGVRDYSARKMHDVFVIAYNYDEAAEKAIVYAETQKQNSIIDSRGDLNLIEEETKVRMVKLVSESIIY